MAKAETTTTRAPRGTKAVSQAFFTALDTIPEAARSVVAKAAQGMISEQIKMRREKAKTTAAKAKAHKPAIAKLTKKATPKAVAVPVAESAPKKIRVPKAAKAAVAA